MSNYFQLKHLIFLIAAETVLFRIRPPGEHER